MKKNPSFRLTFLFSRLRGVRGVFCAAFASALLAAACGDDGTGPERPTLAGTWRDAIEEVDGNTFDLQLTLTQSGSSIIGNYALTVGLPLGSGSVTGTYNHPDVRLSFPLTVNLLGSSVSTSCTYSASVNQERNQMRGTLLCQEAEAGDISMEEVRVDLTMNKQ